MVLAGTYYKDRWSDDGGASHGYIVPDIPEYTNPKGIESFLREIDYYGLFSVEYGLYKGVAYFYEFNLRKMVLHTYSINVEPICLYRGFMIVSIMRIMCLLR